MRTTNSTPIEFARNDEVTIGHGADFQVEIERPLPDTLLPGRPLYLGDSEVVLRVNESLDGGYVCTAVDGGVLRAKKGVTTPGVDLGLGTINVENKKDINAAIAQQIECIVLSFVRSAQDVIECRSLVGASTKIVSKIETLDAIENLDAIVEASDSVMVARGDLALQAGYERLGVLQWRITAAALRRDKPFIVATQVFETVIDQVVPSRSDLHDLSCAAAMGANLVMFGPETCMNSENLRAIETASLVLNAVQESGIRIHFGNFA